MYEQENIKYDNCVFCEVTMCSLSAVCHNPEQTAVFTVTAIRTSKCQITQFWHQERMKSSCTSIIFQDKFLHLKNTWWEVPTSQGYFMESYCIQRVAYILSEQWSRVEHHVNIQ